MSEVLSTSELPPTKRVRFHKMRIAVSAFFGLLTLILVVMWVRSYWRYESAHWPAHELRVSSVVSYRGSWCISKALPSPGWLELVPTKLEIWSRPIEIEPSRLKSQPQFDSRSDQLGWWIRFPHWLPITSVVMLTAIPWIPMSRRTLIFATTLIAILLGLATWVGR